MEADYRQIEDAFSLATADCNHYKKTVEERLKYVDDKERFLKSKILEHITNYDNSMFGLAYENSGYPNNVKKLMKIMIDYYTDKINRQFFKPECVFSDAYAFLSLYYKVDYLKRLMDEMHGNNRVPTAPKTFKNLSQDSDTLLALFSGQSKVLSKFVERMKKLKKPYRIIADVQALIDLGVINDGNKHKNIYTELSKIMKIGTIQNWNDTLITKHSKEKALARQIYESLIDR